MPLAHPDEAMRRRAPVYSDAQIRALVAYTETLDPTGPGVPHPRPQQASLPKGAELYLENCAACHSTTAIGGALARGVPQKRNRHERTATFAPGLSRATPTEIAEAVRVGPGTMPVFGPGALSDRDVDAIVRYVGYLQHPRDRGGLAIGRIGPVAEGAVAWIVGVGLLLAVSCWIGTRT
jgi:ubiquinol-cytochrome c reductase cytochrome c subunit